MAIDVYNWRELTEAVNKIVDPPAFLKSTIFKTKEQHIVDYIDYEVIDSSKNLATPVSKSSPPASVKQGVTHTAKTCTLPRFFESKTLDATTLMEIGVLGSNYVDSAAQVISGADKRILEELDELKYRVYRRIEQMCASALTTGTISLTGDNVTYSYDFGFQVGVHKVSPTGAWSNTSSRDIPKDIKSWKTKIYERTGVTPTVLILGKSAAQYFIDDAKVQKYLDTLNFRVGALQLEEIAKQGAIYLGHFLGVDVYEYSFVYGGSTQAWAEDYAVMVAPDNTFKLHFGSIDKIENGSAKKEPVEILVEAKDDNYNRGLILLAESKCLPVIHNPDLVVVCDTV